MANSKSYFEDLDENTPVYALRDEKEKGVWRMISNSLMEKPLYRTMSKLFCKPKKNHGEKMFIKTSFTPSSIDGIYYDLFVSTNIIQENGEDKTKICVVLVSDHPYSMRITDCAIIDSVDIIPMFIAITPKGDGVYLWYCNKENKMDCTALKDTKVSAFAEKSFYPYVRMRFKQYDDNSSPLVCTYSTNTNNSNPDGGTSNLVHILGRNRKIVMIGRKKMVKYCGQLIPLVEARKIERQKQNKNKKQST